MRVRQMNSTTQIHNVQSIAFITNSKATSTGFPSKHKEKSCKHDFEEMFLETVDSAFLLIGESSRQAIYYHLENRYGIKRESIPWNVKKFAKALEDFFGQGARLLEIKMMRTLHDQLCGFKYLPERDEFSFTGYVEAVRRFL